jgi:hypothetical protein
MNHKGEIRVNNCFATKYPYKWTTPDGRTVILCRFMVFPNNFPDDIDNPHPECINPKPKVIIPKDHIIKDPQICWTCYKLQKKERTQKLYQKTVRSWRDEQREKVEEEIRRKYGSGSQT